MTLEERVTRLEQHLGLQEKSMVQYYRNLETREVVRVDHADKSVMLVCGDSFSDYHETVWNWQQIPHIVHDGQELWDGCLVECYDTESYFRREIAFFDVKNKTSFGLVDGKRGGADWRHYKLIPHDKWPEWAHEAYKRLEL